eukprot:6204513-Pleurochrysis_carterae.AAC.3
MPASRQVSNAPTVEGLVLKLRSIRFMQTTIADHELASQHPIDHIAYLICALACECFGLLGIF